MTFLRRLFRSSTSLIANGVPDVSIGVCPSLIRVPDLRMMAFDHRQVLWAILGVISDVAV
jgi:hypothetical protein